MVDETAGEAEYLRHGARADDEPFARSRRFPDKRVGGAVEVTGHVNHLVRLDEAPLHRNRERRHVPVVFRRTVRIAGRLFRAPLRKRHAHRAVRIRRRARGRQNQFLLRMFGRTVAISAAARPEHDPRAQTEPVRLMQRPAETVGQHAVHLSLERRVAIRPCRRDACAIADHHERGDSDLRKLLQIACNDLPRRLDAEVEHPHGRIVLLRRRHEPLREGRACRHRRRQDGGQEHTRFHTHVLPHQRAEGFAPPFSAFSCSTCASTSLSPVGAAKRDESAS